MMNRAEHLYEIGDLVELARFGFSPKSERDRVFGLVVGVIEPIDHFVPRYRVQLNYRPENGMEHLDDFIVSRNDRVITVMEYDIVATGAAGEKGRAQE